MHSIPRSPKSCSSSTSPPIQAPYSPHCVPAPASSLIIWPSVPTQMRSLLIWPWPSSPQTLPRAGGGGEGERGDGGETSVIMSTIQKKKKHLLWLPGPRAWCHPRNSSPHPALPTPASSLPSLPPFLLPTFSFPQVHPPPEINNSQKAAHRGQSTELSRFTIRRNLSKNSNSC